MSSNMAALCLILTIIVCYLQTTAAQYQCSPSNCTPNNYDRSNVMGCKYFCYLDVFPTDGALECQEFFNAFNSWKGNDQGCDRECYVPVHKTIIPEACDNELNAGYGVLSTLDGDPTDISNADVQLWCDQVKMFTDPPGSALISPDAWAAWWGYLFAEIGDPECNPPAFRRH